MGVNQNVAKARVFLASVMTLSVAALLAWPFACTRPTSAPTPPPTYERASAPVLDIHTHLAPDATDTILRLFDQRGTRMAVNLSGGMPSDTLEAIVAQLNLPSGGGRLNGGLEESLAQQQASHGRILPFCTLPWRLSDNPQFAQLSVSILERCRALGIRGLKIQKVLGLVARDLDGSRLPVDSPRLDPIFDAVGRLGMVVLIHAGDPRAFFEPPTPQNERWEELSQHPAWSFYGPQFPTFDQVLSEFERRVLRHPNTRFIGAHFGNAAEDPDRVARLLERAPNYYIDTSARVPEFGRHPAAQMRAFFQRWQDRVLYGTDLGLSNDPSTWVLGSGGDTPTTQADVNRFFTSTFRYFESNDGSIENPTPIQGRWPVHPVGLSRDVLRKIYGANAARLLGISWPPT
jgi:predicted TIM-barrel fold metal-dependent hydrolase